MPNIFQSHLQEHSPTLHFFRSLYLYSLPLCLSIYFTNTRPRRERHAFYSRIVFSAKKNSEISAQSKVIIGAQCTTFLLALSGGRTWHTDWRIDRRTPLVVVVVENLGHIHRDSEFYLRGETLTTWRRQGASQPARRLAECILYWELS